MTRPRPIAARIQAVVPTSSCDSSVTAGARETGAAWAATGTMVSASAERADIAFLNVMLFPFMLQLRSTTFLRQPVNPVNVGAIPLVVDSSQFVLPHLSQRC